MIDEIAVFVVERVDVERPSSYRHAQPGFPHLVALTRHGQIAEALLQRVLQDRSGNGGCLRMLIEAPVRGSEHTQAAHIHRRAKPRTDAMLDQCAAESLRAQPTVQGEPRRRAI